MLTSSTQLEYAIAIYGAVAPAKAPAESRRVKVFDKAPCRPGMRQLRINDMYAGSQYFFTLTPLHTKMAALVAACS